MRHTFSFPAALVVLPIVEPGRGWKGTSRVIRKQSHVALLLKAEHAFVKAKICRAAERLKTADPESPIYDFEKSEIALERPQVEGR